MIKSGGGMGLNIEIKERRLQKKRVYGDYVQYMVNIPKRFVDKHKTDRVFWIADDLLIMAPSKEAIMRIIKLIPEIEEATGDGGDSHGRERP
jgi:hypothetical protein